MPLWASATVVFFAYVALVASLPIRLIPRQRAKLFAASAAGILAAISAARTDAWPILHNWLLPPALLLAAYWTSGLLFVAPMPRAERLLLRIDRWLGVPAAVRRSPRWMAEILELAYLGVYPVIPLALILHLVFSSPPDPTHFWSVVLVTDYVCFGVLALVQTRPPRAIETERPWPSRVRRFNVRLLGASSIQVNTFPSGHAAEAMVCAFLVLDTPWPLAGWMMVNALAIAAGTVLGRYHYAADALTGWVVAGAVYAALA